MDNTVLTIIGGIILAIGPLSIAGVFMKIGSYKTTVDALTLRLGDLEKKSEKFISEEEFDKDLQELKKEVRFARQEDMKTIKSLEQKIDDFSARVMEKLETISNQTSAASAKEELILQRIGVLEKKG